MRFFVLSSLVLAACNTPTNTGVPGQFAPKGEVVLKVNDTVEVYQDMVDALTRLMPADELAQRKESGSYVKLVEQVAMGEVLYREALAQGLHKDESVLRAIDMKAREVLAQEVLQKKVDALITDEAIQAHYDERAVQFKRPQARARHILVQEEALANEIMDKLGKGEDFAALASEHSIDARTRGEGGDLGWFRRDKLVEEVASVAFEKELNKPNGPIKTRFGFHIIEPLERRQATPLEDVKSGIVNDLRQKFFQQVLTEMKDSMKYERFGEVLEIHNKTDEWGVTGAGGPGGAPPPPHGAGGPGGPPHGAGGPGGPPPGAAPHGAPPHRK